MKVLVAMSGGVDSSGAALILKNRGYDIAGAIMKLSPDMKQSDIDAAKAVCDKLGCPFYEFDCRQLFEEKVMQSFCTAYLEGRTPNPCVECNKYLKFGYFLNEAIRLGYDRIATGHYAKIIEKDGKYSVSRAECLKKDQSYVLWQLTQDVLSRVILPLGDVPDKEFVRGLTEAAGLVTAHKSESQDICFVPNGDFGAFIERYANITPKSGNFIDKDGKVLGQHRGIHNYTVGQRRFLNIALGHRAFVTEKNIINNTVTLGLDEDLFTLNTGVSELNFQSIPRLLPGQSINALAQIRYGKNAADAVLTVTGDNCGVCRFEVPQRAPAPGQSIVFYDGETLVCGGIICKLQRNL